MSNFDELPLAAIASLGLSLEPEEKKDFCSNKSASTLPSNNFDLEITRLAHLFCKIRSLSRIRE